MMAKLTNQIAVVSGASGGIGGAIAAALADEGAAVCLVGRDRARLDAAARRLRPAPGPVETWQMYLERDEDIEALTAHVTQQHGRLDILVHSAGAIDHGRLDTTPVESLDRQYRANVRGPLLLTQRMLPLLKNPRGQIVFINSSAGLAAKANSGHFSATQHAFKALADSLREEVNEQQVRVLNVHPGRTATPRIEALHAKEGRTYRPELLLQPEDVASVVVNAVTLPWTAEVTSISIRAMQKSY